MVPEESPAYAPLLRVSPRLVLIGEPDGAAVLWILVTRWRRGERCVNCGAATRRAYRPVSVRRGVRARRLCFGCVAVEDWPIVHSRGERRAERAA